MRLPGPAKDMFKALRQAMWNSRLSRLPSGPNGSRLLHIGCGDVNSPEFINLDARPLPHVHIVSRNIFNLRSIPDASLDMVYMSHVLEHVPRGQLLQTLKEMGRVLKTGGLLRISVPDFDHIIRIYEETGGDIHAIAPALMGGQDYEFNFHYSVFNKHYLAETLHKAGFTDVESWDPAHCDHHDFDDWASRQINYDGRLFPISLNLQARKMA